MLVSTYQRTKTGSGLIWENGLPQPPELLTTRAIQLVNYPMGKGRGEGKDL